MVASLPGLGERTSGSLRHVPVPWVQGELVHVCPVWAYTCCVHMACCTHT